ncbi:signal peptidase I [Candidatus Peregrinibacteria bacterium]|nr:signal peptidase I [Candidatus Peregrinibacteria bacterium]
MVVILVYGVRTYLISPFQVYGPSMCDTLNYVNETCQEKFGEYLIVNKAVYYPFFGKRFGTPKRGDIVVFHPPQNKKDYYIKRIIGLPGEKVIIQSGKVIIASLIGDKEYGKGVELPESYLSAENRGKTLTYPSQLIAEYVVPEDSYFVLGDNRRKSTDSRTCFRIQGSRECDDEKNHFLPISMIEGKAWVVLWPFGKTRLLTKDPYVSAEK